MNCLPCFNNDDDEEATDPLANKDTPAQTDAAKEAAASSSNAKTFNFRELAMATKNFRQECLLGEGGFGRVFKGKLQSTGQVVAVKQLDRNGMQGNKEFLVEVMMLSLIQHQNLVSLIGYCADGDQRLLVYEYLQMGSLENHLFGDNPDKKPMDWYTRMKISAGVANGLEYLHDKVNPPMIYRDLKPSNILLDESYEPKLSDFGLAKLGAGGGNVNPASRVMGTYGYSAPEYSSGGELTLKSDMYSFGVLLLELITGRRAIDTTRPNDEQNLVTWAQPIFREPKRFPDLADPRLNNDFPLTSLNQAVGICAMCLQEEPGVRPLIGDVVPALSFLAMPQPSTTNAHAPPSEQKMHYETESKASQPSQSDKDSSCCDDKSSEGSDSSEDEEDFCSDQRNQGSSQNSVGEKESSTRSSERESERQDSDRRHSFDNNSEEQSTYSDSDSGGDDTNYEDAETTELEGSQRSRSEDLYSAQSTDSSLKSYSGNKSSKHGSSRRSSSTKINGSRRRKPVVTFKEPSLSAKKNGTRPEGEYCSSDNNNNNNQTVPAATATDGRQQHSSSSSSSESSSESEDEKEPPRHEEDTKNSRENNIKEEDSSSTDRNEANHRVFDQSQKEAPKLRHLKTR